MRNDENSALRELFVEQLQEIYDAEKQLLDALLIMANAASSPELKSSLEEHQDVTQMQLERLQQVANLLDTPVRNKTCKAMEILIEEGEELIDRTEEESMVRDCALIIAVQKIENYEVGMYGSLRSVAEILELAEIADLLQATLDEEKEADERMTELAVSYVAEEAEDDH